MRRLNAGPDCRQDLLSTRAKIGCAFGSEMIADPGETGRQARAAVQIVGVGREDDGGILANQDL